MTPVLVDVDFDTFNISVESLTKAITPKTKAIVPVHLFGQNADMESILAIAKKHNLFVVEDACQSIGSVYTFSDGHQEHSGCMGDIGCTSFFPSKNLGCFGDGGAIFTNNDELAAKMRIISNHGMQVRYYHDEVGVNSRLDTIQAAVLEVKLKHLNEYCANRQAAAQFYNTAFEENDKIITPAQAPNSTHVFHQYTLKLNGVNRTELIKYLAESGIPAMIYYPVPLHFQKAYQDTRYQAGDFPVAESTELSTKQLEYITKSVLEFIQ
jgi:UDP-2-acetamido-2-deoxy-ribo-hexuluronate aminotransferase